MRETAVNLLNQITGVCKRNGESLSTVLGECCSLIGKPGQDAREVVSNVFDSVVQEKGIRTAFSKLLSEGSVDGESAPDWVYLLFKVKSRISGSAWQDLTIISQNWEGQG